MFCGRAWPLSFRRNFLPSAFNRILSQISGLLVNIGELATSGSLSSAALSLSPPLQASQTHTCVQASHLHFNSLLMRISLTHRHTDTHPPSLSPLRRTPSFPHSLTLSQPSRLPEQALAELCKFSQKPLHLSPPTPTYLNPLSPSTTGQRLLPQAFLQTIF